MGNNQVNNIHTIGIYKKINLAIEALEELKKTIAYKDNIGDWSRRDEQNIDLLRDGSNALNLNNLENFRGKQIYVSDYPSVTLKGIYFKNKIYYKFMGFINLIIGSRRGEIKVIKDQIDFIKKNGAYKTLIQNSDSSIGNPMHYRYCDINITGRYLRHIYFYNIFKNEIFKNLQDNFVALDIGSSYGIFSGLLKTNSPISRHILVDLEGQMILAEYYLSRKFPEAKIANAKDIIENGAIDSDFVKKYDFILVPVELFDFLLHAEVDLVTNFLSLGEMSRYWFDKYINSKVFNSAKFLFTVNRYDSAPTYSNQLTVLDYQLQKYMTIRMRNCTFFRVYVEGILFFFFRLKPHSSGVFEFIGKKKK